ncbi:hypothetical protein FACS1894179_06890 [Bacteroidia bacterium]|nr:hypothetical protein FACS1894179_06890 [Bacteroidia bacterium]
MESLSDLDIYCDLCKSYDKYLIKVLKLSTPNAIKKQVDKFEIEANKTLAILNNMSSVNSFYINRINEMINSLKKEIE